MKEIIIPRNMMLDYESQTYHHRMVDDDTLKTVLDGSYPAFDRLHEAISQAEKGCRARLLNICDVLETLLSLEATMNISKKALDGVECLVDIHAQDFPRSYRSVPMSTIFRARYHAGTWRILSVQRGRCCRPRVIVTHTVASWTDIIQNYTRFD